MIRLRKYRIFLAVTLCCLLAVYFFSKAGSQYTPESWASLRTPPVSVKPPGPGGTPKRPLQNAAVAPGKFPQPDVANGRLHPPPTSAPLPDMANPPEGSKSPQEPGQPPPEQVHNLPAGAGLQDLPGDPAAALDAAPTASHSALVVPGPPTPTPHWTPKTDTFPVPTESLILLPSGAPMPIPRIQHVFSAESASDKSAREKKLDAIKAAFKRTWDGYRQRAWMQDELMPVTGSYKSKWSGWGATLVDSLDTLWIMGMQPEFEEAVKATGTLDFTTSDRDSIPVFETTIRYLGGLLGAYDVSGGKYQILLDKAKELGEVLMGAFDTPNRMPILFFEWQGTRSQNVWRASSTAVLAELGSLSLEFTRLAQLTHNSKYYDAIARITNELEIFQNKTEVPGLWPLNVDTSGCGPPPPEDRPYPSKDENTFGTDRQNVPEPHDALNVEDMREKDKTSFVEDATTLAKRQGAEVEEPAHTDAEAFRFDSYVNCPPAGLQTGGSAYFGIGGEADSTYEYLPKEYLLLGGLNNQYHTMYDNAASAIKEYLVYRPMIEDEKREILFTGKFAADPSTPSATGRISGSFDTSVGHLTCFQGGMFGLAAKIFDRKADLDLASKLTDACVWGYDSSGSGIMPEDMTPVQCPSLTDCPWNKTMWWREIDPMMDSRTSRNARDVAGRTDTVLDAAADAEPETLDKRQGDETKLVEPETHSPALDADDPRTLGHRAALPFSHEGYVQRRIADEGLWPGIKGFQNTNYLLRPEAIESVWYMYRITGDEYWRQKGWKMFQAVETNTKTEYGNSAIQNVQKANVLMMDEMESFWTAETLKYFFLLFSDPDVINLDDYVLSTEAHPLLRPDSKKQL